ncbi:MAG: ATP synthase subunit I [Bryobacteraceae bacterium]
MRTDEAYFDRALGRMQLSMAALGLGGAAFVFALYSWRHGLGYMAGALASLANFRWLHQLTASLGPNGQRARRRVLLFLLLRYFLLGAGGYVIVKIFGLNLAAALVGLFVAVAAVIVEIIYELIYARA